MSVITLCSSLLLPHRLPDTLLELTPPVTAHRTKEGDPTAKESRNIDQDLGFTASATVCPDSENLLFAALSKEAFPAENQPPITTK